MPLAYLPGLLLGGCQRLCRLGVQPLGGLAGLGAALLCFGVDLLARGLGLFEPRVGVGVQPADRRERLVARGLGLRDGALDDLLSLVLGRPHAMFGGAVGLGYALAGARLGLRAQLGRRSFGGLHDVRDARGGAGQPVGGRARARGRRAGRRFLLAGLGCARAVGRLHRVHRRGRASREWRSPRGRGAGAPGGDRRRRERTAKGGR